MDEAAEAEAPPNADEAEISGWHMDEAAWYDTVVTHWTKAVSAEDNDGVLGGWGCVDEEDARGSLAFLAQTLGVPAAQWQAAARRLSPAGWHKLLAAVTRALRAAEHPLAPALVTDSLLVQYSDLIAAEQGAAPDRSAGRR